MMRFAAQHRAALEFIESGRLGVPVYARAQFSTWYPPIEGAWRQDPSTGGGGALIDMGSHCIDLLEMLFGPVGSVSCILGRTVHPYASEDSAVVLLRFRTGALATVDAFFCIPDAGSENRLELYGSRGSILARGTIGQDGAGEMVAHLDSDAAPYDPLQPARGRKGTPIAPQPLNPYLAEVEEFSLAIIEGRQPSHDGRLGLRSQLVVAACYESARLGRAQDVPDVETPTGPASLGA